LIRGLIGMVQEGYLMILPSDQSKFLLKIEDYLRQSPEVRADLDQKLEENAKHWLLSAIRNANIAFECIEDIDYIEAARFQAKADEALKNAKKVTDELKERSRAKRERDAAAT
jgi:hypothetical protein